MRVNFRDVADRFGHIDGTIVRAEASFADHGRPASARVVLSFYPWWEHPMYVAARDAGASWGFADGEAGARDMLVEAESPLRCELRTGTSATDIAFYCEHPALWEFEDGAEIFCNSYFEPRELINALVQARLPHVTQAILLHYIAPYAKTPPFALGVLPRTLFTQVKRHLRAMGVDLFIPREPAETTAPILFTADDNVVIVAEDFYVDVPEFEHRPEWFAPDMPGRAG